jgi:hypothetical protein
LIESLVQWDLQGHLEYQNRAEGGARVRIEFPLSGPYSKPCEQSEAIPESTAKAELPEVS